MFERYTEKARRVIFFSRYEASQFGSSYIEAEHILLGLLREDTALAGRLSLSPLSPEKIRNRIEEGMPRRERLSTSIDMPLSPAAKKVLAAAGEEADSFGHSHVGTEHILLGILQEEETLAAKLLVEAGMNVTRVRDDLRGTDRYPGRKSDPLPNWNQDCIEIHGDLFSFTSVRELAVHYRKFHWEKRQWTPRDALARRSDERLFLYSGQSYDAEQSELVKGGWTEDHCAICWWKLDGSPQHLDGYTNGQDWLCTECHDRFVNPPSPPAP